MDIKQLSEEQILDLLAREEKIPYYTDLSINPLSRPAMDSFQDIISQEQKLSRALSRGISESKKFHGKTKAQDIIKELASDMKVQVPDLEFKYSPGLVGSMDTQKGLMSLNPELMGKYGKEAVIAHELRHFKEASPEYTPDLSVRRMLYTNPEGEGIRSLERLYGVPESIQKEKGKSLAYYNKLKDRLFPNDKMKPSIDALDAYDFLERGHFNKSFMKENLQRVAKKLPIIGTAATALGIATAPNPAEAAAEEGISSLIPGGVEDTAIADERSIPDPKYQEYIRRMSQRKK